MNFTTKQECEFYNIMNFQILQQNPSEKIIVKKDSIKVQGSIIHLELSKGIQTIIVNICIYKCGIFRLIISDSSGRGYRNKSNIGENLSPESNFSYNINDHSLVVNISDEEYFSNLINTSHIYQDSFDKIKKNKYSIVLYFDNFSIDYFLNDFLVSSFNKNGYLNCPIDYPFNKIDLTLYNSLHVYGLPERLSDFPLKDDSYRLFNLDFFDQTPGSSKPLYGSIPMLHSINTNSKGSNDDQYIHSVFFLNNSSEIWVDINSEDKNKNTLWTSGGGLIDFYFVSDFNPEFNSHKISLITGFFKLPAMFTLGYHQCRWGYLTRKEIEDIDENMNKHSIPYDVMWLDIDHTRDKRYFTWNDENFPKMEEYLSKLKSQGRSLVTIIDPHIKVDEDYTIANILKEKDVLVKNEDKSLFIGNCWPGSSYYSDFINYEKIQPIYDYFFKDETYFLNHDNIHTWIDMNEPSVFNSKDNTMPGSALHFDGKDFVPHSEIHNIYGHFYHKVTYNSLKNRYDNKIRPFVLSRSFYAGSQQYGFIWTGDNRSTDKFMKYSIDMIKSISLCGLSACGADVGGFFEDPTENLLREWFKLGSFYPFFRGHSHCESICREPWLFSEPTLQSIRESIKQRYRLLLFWYTKFYEHTLTGIPIVKPLWFKFFNLYQESTSESKYNDLFIVGDEFIIIPYKGSKIPSELREISIFYNFISGEIFKGTSEGFTQLVIGGSIIPFTENVSLSAANTVINPLTLLIYLNEFDEASGNLYWDDGVSFQYLSGEYNFLSLNFSKGQLKIVDNNKFNLFTDNSKEINSVNNVNLKVSNIVRGPLIEKVSIYGNNIKRTFSLLDYDIYVGKIHEEVVIKFY